MDPLRWVTRPELESPVLIAAFEGWNDAGEAASAAVTYLVDTWEAETFATLDPEEFYDFTVVRPQVRLDDDRVRHIDWPANSLSHATIPGTGRSVVLLQGIEPQLKWRTFSDAFVGIARDLGVELVVTLGALLTDTPHTRPVRVTGTAADPDLIARLNLVRSGYEGPTGIVGVLHDALGTAGIPSASLWAAVPHYVGQNPSPKATLALVQRLSRLLGTSIDAVDLQIASASWERQVSEAVEADDDMVHYVQRLEESDDDPELPERDVLAAEVERFLREQGGRSS